MTVTSGPVVVTSGAAVVTISTGGKIMSDRFCLEIRRAKLKTSLLNFNLLTSRHIIPGVECRVMYRTGKLKMSRSLSGSLSVLQRLHLTSTLVM